MNARLSGHSTGRLIGVGVGPGDPELLTLKALRHIRAAPVVAYPAPDDGPSFARSIVADHLRGQTEIIITVPMRAERFPAREVYERAAAEIAPHLDAGRDVVVLCEGDPFFYGSFMYLHERLAPRYPCEVVPGVSSVMAAGAASGRPLASRNDALTVLPGPSDDATVRRVLAATEACAIIKVGRHLPRLRDLVAEAGLLERAWYGERVTLASERLMPLKAVEPPAPYFSIILIYNGAEGWADVA